MKRKKAIKLKKTVPKQPKNNSIHEINKEEHLFTDVLPRRVAGRPPSFLACIIRLGVTQQV